MIIAIDGPAASGKGTLGRRIAAHYGLAYLDTGLLYRAVARDVLAAGFRLEDSHAAAFAARSIDPGSLDDPGLRGQATGAGASIVASQPDVRAELLAYQRGFAARRPGAVLDGRDIGTIVCPDADVKLFITATPEARARRRYLELAGTDPALREPDVLADIKARDARDQNRTVAPLHPAHDAHLLDTTELGIDAAFHAAVALIDMAIGRSGCA